MATRRTAGGEGDTHWAGEPVDVWARLWSVPLVEAHRRIGSTNDRALRLGRAGAPAWSVVVADEQVRGRGRAGRTWQSEAGAGLWMSVILPVRAPAALHLPLLVGIGAARAVEDAAPDVRARIEWPNDIIVAGRKVGGILCESAGSVVVAGIGINLTERAVRGLTGAAALRAGFLDRPGGPVPRGTLAGGLVRELRRVVPVSATALAGAIRRELEARDALRGMRVVSEQAGPGVACGIDADGALLVRTEEDGVRTVRVVGGSVRAVRPGSSEGRNAACNS